MSNPVAVCGMCGYNLYREPREGIHPLIGILISGEKLKRYSVCLAHLNNNVVLKASEELQKNRRFRRMWRIAYFKMTGEAVKYKPGEQP